MQNQHGALRDKLLLTENQDSKSNRSLNSHTSRSSDFSHRTEQQLGLISQIWILVYKNIILTFKNPKNIIFLTITPFLLSAFLFVFEGLARDSGQRTLQVAAETPLPNFGHCYGKDCISLQYRIITQSLESPTPDWVQYVIEYIHLQTGLQQSDIVQGSNIVTVDDLQAYYDYEVAHPNRTQIALLFCDGKSEDILLNGFYCNGSTYFTYYLVLNKTDSLSVIFHDYLQPLPIDTTAAALKLLVDNAILSRITRSGGVANRSRTINYSHAQFPVGQNKYIDNYDIVTTIGAFYYLITPLFAFLFIQNEIVREKEYKLRQGLNIFGASHIAYWTSWFVVSSFYSLVVACSTYTAGIVFGFGFFRDTPFFVIIFLLMYPFTLAMQMLAYFISALAPSLKASNTVSYGIMLFAIVVESFVSDNFLLTFLFSEDVNGIVAFLKIFLCFYPPFSYTKIFTNITQYSGYHFSITQRRWVQAQIPYDMHIYTQNIQAPLPFGGGLFYRYSDLYSTLILLGDSIFFLLLTWYCDHTISSNRGRNEPFYFPFNRIWERFRKEKPRVYTDEVAPVENTSFSMQMEEESAVRQRNKVYSNQRRGLPAHGLRIKNLSKTFQGIFSRNKVQALRNFTLQIEPNELMGILGHNGAGKTTLINILTGVIPPDQIEGSQIMIGNEPISNINQIRKHIGVCAQFDILWDELTAEDHLYMFAKLKGIPKDQLNARIDQMLEFVSLLPEKKNRVGSFSGGMKRRLSLAIAAVGNPKIILLDEPTTGLDPKVRSQVWQLIEKLKQGKSIILTTHSMQQADVLADRICVVSRGKMKCVGSSFYLKKMYGQGHRITINLRHRQDEKEVVSRIQKMFAGAKLVDCRGGSLIMGVSDYHQLLNLVKKLQSKDSLGLDEYELKKSIRAWAVSHSTLQQVFMKVSREKEQ